MNNESLQRLRKAVTDSNITQVAKKMGIPRCTLSMVFNGKYPADPKNILSRFDEVYGWVQCPYLKGELTFAQCREYYSKSRPSGPLGLQHWRACRQCEFNGDQS